MAKIKINNLFGLYNNEIDLDRRCNILIGENGVGKSTILKIIKCIADLNFIELAEFYFDSISIISDAGSVDIKYADLFPSYKAIIEELGNHLQPCAISDPKNPEDGITNIDYMIRALSVLKNVNGGKYLCHYLSACYFNKPISRAISRYINKYLTVIFRKDDHPTSSEIIKETLTSLQTRISLGFLLAEKHIIYLFRDSDVYRNIEEIKYIVRGDSGGHVEDEMISFEVNTKGLDLKEIYYFDLVKQHHLSSELNMDSIVSSRIVSWIKSFPADRFEKRDILFGIESIYPSEYTDGVSEAMRSLLRQNTDDYSINPSLKVIKEQFIERLSFSQIVDINKLVSFNYYDWEFIRNINQIAFSYYKDLIGKDTEIPQEYNEIWSNGEKCNDYIDSFYLNEDIYQNIIHFIRPVILKDSEFDIDFIYKRDQIQEDNPCEFTIFDIAYRKFYDHEFHRFKENKSEKIKTLEMLLKKYISNKDILLTPSGMIVQKISTVERKKGNFAVIENEQFDIPLDNLSSGEKKIILLFLVCLFFDEATLLIDEPELSLSIIWQEQLLPDLLKYTTIKQLIVATHSPFIASDEDLKDYIVPLPTEDE